MKHYRVILKKVGAVLVIVASIDIALWVYYVTNNLSYSSNFNIPSVVAGIFLLRADLKAAQLITSISAFMFSFIGATLLLTPFLKPAELWVTELRFKPTTMITSFAVTFVTVGVMFWIYRQLRSAPVVFALQNAGRSTSPPKFAFGLGVGLVIFFAAIWYLTLNSDSATKAIELARVKYGEQYQYHPTSILWSGKHTSATLVAYSEREIKSVMVHWDQ